MTGTVLAIVGPTAAGKTALSLEVAEALGAEIVSMDSAMVYRGMVIGTDKLKFLHLYFAFEQNKIYATPR